MGALATRLGRVPSFGKFMKWCTIVCLSVVVGVVIYASEGDDYLFLFNRLKDSTGALMGKFAGGSDNSTVSSGAARGTVGDGSLNLDLIDRIPDVSSGKVGYIKELLSIYRDGEKGKLSSYKYFSMTTFLGMHTQEVGSDGNIIPNYYFKPSSWKKDTAHHCFMDYTSSSLGVLRDGGLDEDGGYGPFQNKTVNGTASKVKPLSVSRRGSSDVRFLPDMIATANAKVNDSLKDDVFKVLSGDQQAVLAGSMNNRGSGGALYALAGISTASDYSDDQDKYKGMSKEVLNNTFISIYNMWISYFNGKEKKAAEIAKFDAEYRYAAAILIVLQQDGWYCSKNTQSYLKQNKGISNVWKFLMGSNYSEQKLDNFLKDKISTLPDSIKEVTGSNVSSDDCKKVYGTTLDYRDSGYSYLAKQPVWRVTKQRTGDLYTNKYTNGDKPYIVSSFDNCGIAYYLSVSKPVGEAIYANLLKEAGVNSVDPTNPATYKNLQNVVANSGTQLTPTWSGELSSHYKGYGIDQSKLTPDRIAVLNKAAEMAYDAPFFYSQRFNGLKRETGHYGWCTVGSDTGFSTDCAHFCELSYAYAGFKMQHFTTSMLADGSASAYFEKISFSNIKPGDIVVTWGHHAVLYLSGKSIGDLTVIDAAGRNGKRYDDQVAIRHTDRMVGGKVLRSKFIDKGKRGADIPVPHNKPKTDAECRHPYPF